jgi:TetR/AcrR family transcriptional regulator
MAKKLIRKRFCQQQFIFIFVLTIWLNYMGNKKTDGTEEKIFAAAKKIFLLNGMSGARMQDIADEAGINKALLHYYFRSKEKLFEVIFQEASTNFFPKIVDVIESDSPFFEKIHKFCSEYIDMMLANPYLPLFVLNEVSKDPAGFKKRFWNNRENLFAKFVKEAEKEIQKKKIKTIKPAHLFINMISMCIFPFIAKQMLMIGSGMNDAQFRAFMEQRKTEVPQFIIESIKNK